MTTRSLCRLSGDPSPSPPKAGVAPCFRPPPRKAGQEPQLSGEQRQWMDLDLCDFVDFLEDDTPRLLRCSWGTEKRPAILNWRAAPMSCARPSSSQDRQIRAWRDYDLGPYGADGRLWEVYEVAFRQFGVISTDTVEAFLGAAQLAAHQPIPAAADFSS